MTTETYESERQAVLDAGDPVETFLNAPDMKYFSEVGTLDIDLSVNGAEALYNAYNSMLDFTYTDDEDSTPAKLVFDLYVDLCRRLETHDFSKALPNRTPDFIIVARDFETSEDTTTVLRS